MVLVVLVNRAARFWRLKASRPCLAVLNNLERLIDSDSSLGAFSVRTFPMSVVDSRRLTRWFDRKLRVFVY